MRMNQTAQQPQLSELRFLYGQFLPNKGANAFVQIRPGRKVKLYRPTTGKGRWVYRPEVMRARGGLKEPSRIAEMVNKQTLDEIRVQANAALEQVIFRAFTNDKRALAYFIATTKKAVRLLPRLVEAQRKSMREEAEKSRDWPVLLSRNPRQRTIAIEQLETLRVGTNALPRPGKRLDPDNLWTRLVIDAYEVCRDNAELLPLFRTFLTGARRSREEKKFWGTKVTATFYYLPSNEADIFIIADWQSKCAKLHEPITEDNFDSWWSAINGCVWEYWRGHKAEYKRALKKIGRSEADECVRRNMAMTQVRQAFETLVGLRSKSS